MIEVIVKDWENYKLVFFIFYLKNTSKKTNNKKILLNYFKNNTFTE